MDVTKIENIYALSMYERIDFIKQIVSSYLDVPYSEFNNPRRKYNIVKLKHYAVYFSKQNTIATEVQLADYFGYKNHSSINLAIQKIERELTWDKSLKKECKEISAIIYLKGLAQSNKINLSDYYYVNMDDFTSIRFNSEKSIIFVGCTDSEKLQIIKILNKTAEPFETREHKNTHKFIMETLHYKEKKQNKNND